MTIAPCTSVTNYVVNLRWHTALVDRLSKKYNVKSWEIILPAFLYSLTSEDYAIKLALFFRANDLTEDLFSEMEVKDILLGGREGISEPRVTDELRSELFADLMVFGRRMRKNTAPIERFIFHPEQIYDITLRKGDLHVKFNPDPEQLYQ